MTDPRYQTRSGLLDARSKILKAANRHHRTTNPNPDERDPFTARHIERAAHIVRKFGLVDYAVLEAAGFRGWR